MEFSNDVTISSNVLHAEMTGWQTLEVIYVFKILFLVGLYASQPQRDPARFSLSSLLEATMPHIRPIVDAGSNKCEAFKSFLGLTYDQMQVKNNTDFHSILNIDLVTKSGNVKYNLTATKRLNKIMDNATTVVILIHGFMESSDGLMVQGVAPELLKLKGLKILALDGRKLINFEYFRSTTYARFMGEKLGSLLSVVIENGQEPSKIVLIGHSLGAHIAGIAGKTVKQLTGQAVGRLVALDPAGPCFSSVDGASRLDRGDASYIDVVHTNAGILGFDEPVGHKDFYPNGGTSQPGCYLSTCDHSRVWELFAESVTAAERFPARKCENWTMFRSGYCAHNEVAYLGMNSEPGSPGKYFLTTARSAPYGLGSAGCG